MADPWESGTEYVPNDVVSYNGLEYIRSFYPETGTSGTPPTDEMSTDPNGDDIRTWTLNAGFTYDVNFRLRFRYFRLIAPPYNTTDEEPEFTYSGGVNYCESAYGSPDGDFGTSIEWDQAIDDSEACPQVKCGVALQQAEEDLVSISVYAGRLTPSTNPRLYHVWVMFNHPLYFRRLITVMVRIMKVTDPVSGPTVTEYTNTDHEITPTDVNYVAYVYSGDIYTEENSVFSFEVPANTSSGGTSISYSLSSVLIKDVDSND